MLLPLLHLFPQCQHGFRGFGLGGRSPIFAVIIMSIVVRRIWDDSHSLDARDLSELRG